MNNLKTFSAYLDSDEHTFILKVESHKVTPLSADLHKHDESFPSISSFIQTLTEEGYSNFSPIEDDIAL